MAAAGGAVLVGGTPVRAFGRASWLHPLRRVDTDRVLVIIQLSGGNDGLNTIVPVQDDLYYTLRPGLAIPASEALPLNDYLGMHPSLASFVPLFGDGHMAVLQNVGYPDPDLSHFRSTDIWVSGSTADPVLDSGWAGRFLDRRFPAFDEAPPPFPLAVQVGGGSPLMFQGPTANMGVSLLSVDLFERIVQTGLVYDEDNLPPSIYGAEMAFVRSVANDSFQYAGVIQEAASHTPNSVEYPANNPLAGNLAVLAQLIKGDLGARIYHVSIGSFDTHANQAATHATLLRQLAEALRAFYDDLAADGLNDRVMTMTFSEFGRRIQQNGSNGTDHGTAAPMFLFGDGLNGGIYGNLPDLAHPDATGNLQYEFDFRAVYATLLQDWFGVDPGTIPELLGQSFDPLPFVSQPIQVGVQAGPPELPEAFSLAQNYPNPFNPMTTVAYTLGHTTHVRLQVFDLQGRLVQTLVNGLQAAGAYAVPFDAANLPSGTYFYRMETPEFVKARKMGLVR